jgi:hypothetical protein
VTQPCTENDPEAYAGEPVDDGFGQVVVLDPNCPTCQTGPGRETTDMVCQTCGTDYAPDARGVSDDAPAGSATR